MQLNKKSKNPKYYKSQRLALLWLLGFLYFGFIGLQLGRIQAITDFSYSLHEIMFVPVNLAIFVVPILTLIYIILLIRYLLRREKQLPSIKASVQTILVIASIILIFLISAYQFQEVSTGGVFTVENKIQNGSKYYFEVDGKKIRVSKNEYELIEENQEYLIDFVWNERSPNEGKLQTIKPFK